MAQPPLQNESFDALQKSLKTALISTTRTTSALCAEDLPFQRSLDSDFARDLDAQNARLLGLAETLLKVAEPAPNANANGKGGDRVRAPRLGDAEELDAKWREVVDVVDSLLERTDGVLDEVKGLLRKGAAAGGGAAAEVGRSCSMMSWGYVEREDMLTHGALYRLRNPSRDHQRPRRRTRRASSTQPTSSNHNAPSNTSRTTSQPAPGNLSSRANRTPKSLSKMPSARSRAQMARRGKCTVTPPQLFIQH